MENLPKPSDNEVGEDFTKEFSLVGKDNKVMERVKVKPRRSLFNKDIKVL